MITLQVMIIRFLAALALGALMGFERERIGKEAGVRTLMLVSGGAAVFIIASLVIPFVTGPAAQDASMAVTTDFARVLANIVVGVGFLGAGIIIKTDERIHGLTTSANVWMAAAVGSLAGAGLISFAIVVAVVVTVLLFVLHNAHFNPDDKSSK